MIRKFEAWNNDERAKRLKEIWAENSKKKDDKYGEFENDINGFLVELVDIGFEVKHKRSNTRIETIIMKGFNGWEYDPAIYGYNAVNNKELPITYLNEIRDNINSLFNYTPISDKIDAIYLNDRRIYTHQMGKLDNLIDDILDKIDGDTVISVIRIHSYLGV